MVLEIVISLIILFMGIAVLVCIHVCIVGRAFRSDINHGHGGWTQGQRSSSNTKRITGDNSSDLKNLPCFDYEEPEKGSSLIDCAVCLENFKVGDACRLLPNCSHSFHVQCIDPWILKTPICPICRTWVHIIPPVLTEESAVSHNVEIEMA
ncbi:RING-H2 finger protein ATL56-like [Gastrolobium bilobum]|uniref:RING-H2 finger protein ATL56-like n=1 Tax=Gastrolobium bilobum TaxID=150636 RepID=UPI002AB0E480|nr:RING-H2 finger protein ATL56-like [Gastrolobium bilobum]